MLDSSSRLRIGVLLTLAPVWALVCSAGAPQETAPAGLGPEHARFLAMTELLLEKKQRRAFLAFEEDWQRDKFIQEFWDGLDPDPDSGRNEFRLVWEGRAETAELEWGRIDDPRAQAFLLNGSPTVTMENPCADTLWPIDLWVYEETDRSGRVVLVFVDVLRSGNYRLWRSQDSPQVLAKEDLRSREGVLSENFDQIADWLAGTVGAVSSPGSRMPWGLTDMDNVGSSYNRERLLLFALMYQNCFNEYQFANLLLEAVGLGDFDPNQVDRLMAAPSDLWDREGSRRPSLGIATDTDTGVALAATVEVSFPARHLSQTVVRMSIVVDATVAEVLEGAAGDVVPESVFRFEVRGDVVRAGDDDEHELFESFRYHFEQPAGPAGTTAPLVIERHLRPGEYRAVLQVEDLVGGATFATDIALHVPRVEGEAGLDAEGDRAAAALEEVAEVLDSETVSVRLELADEGYQVGFTRVGAAVSGEVAKVAFLLDEAEMLVKRRPPYSVELNLGDVPRPHTLEVVAYGDGDEVLARDSVEINRGRYEFRLRMIEPRDDRDYRTTVPVRLDLQVPEDADLDRVEIFLGDRRAATLFQEPWVHEVPISGSKTELVRAVAYLGDGNTSEDAVLINTPGRTERMRVHLVELYASARREGLPFLDLEVGQITVREAGVEQRPLRFERVDDLPLHLCVLLDTSGSMSERLDQARSVAMGFFERSVRPQDRLAVATFHERPMLRVDFTSDVEAMREGLRYLSAGQGTAFHDALVFGLYQFQGMTGQRALLVLSDGRDADSRFSFDEALEYARRSGVTVYSIALKGSAGTARSNLGQLARETGGRLFQIKEMSELDAVYATIESELRSRYLLLYQSSVTDGDLEFRPIELLTSVAGVEIVASSGYYP